VNGTAMSQAVDGTTGAGTTYAASTSAVATTGPTLAQLQALPLTTGLEAAVNTLYGTPTGVTTTNADQLFIRNAAALVLNPTAPPTLRLAVYGLLAVLDETGVGSQAKDAMGRVGVQISAAVNGGTAATTGSVNFFFDPATGLPLEVSTVLGGTTTVTVVTSVTTSTTLPTDPFSS
jgi:hypothetical protein